jgi:hypothetical protein
LGKAQIGNFLEYPNLRVIQKEDNKLLDQLDAVPDRNTALKIAKAVWVPIYGRKNLNGYIYKVDLVENEGEYNWAISGVKRFHVIFKINGGGPFIVIHKMTGKIINVGHSGANPRL